MEQKLIQFNLPLSSQSGRLSYHPPSNTLSRWSAQALSLFINTPINRTVSESLIVPDYCLYLLKNQNINAIQKWEAFCESVCQTADDNALHAKILTVFLPQFSRFLACYPPESFKIICLTCIWLKFVDTSLSFFAKAAYQIAILSSFSKLKTRWGLALGT